MKKKFLVFISFILLFITGCSEKINLQSEFNSIYQSDIKNNESYDYYSSNYYELGYLAGCYTRSKDNDKNITIVFTNKDKDQLNSAMYTLDENIEDLDNYDLVQKDNDEYIITFDNTDQYLLSIQLIDDYLNVSFVKLD